MGIPGPLQEGIPAGAPSSRRDEAAAGWYEPGEGPPLGDWQADLGKRSFPKWDTFSWLSVRTLLESANDAIAKRAPTIIRDRRRRYVAAQRTAGAERADHGPPTPALGSFGPDFVVDWTGLKRPRFLLVGDPGEADASQYATIAPLLEVHDGGPAWEGGGLDKSDFMVVLSDVIYPAGDVNDYVNGFYIPFRHYDRPIYAIPGNHDWYDGLSGFMFHHCGAEPLATLRLANVRRRPGERLRRALWQRASKPDRDLLAPYMQERARLNLLRFGDVEPDPHAQRRPVQPAPYFAIELDELFLVAIDTGVAGELDAEQGEWLLRISARPKPKVLLTGKPIWVNNDYRCGEIAWGDKRRSCTVDDIVRYPPHGYVAAIGGDTHNFQRYPVRVGDRTIQYIVAGGSGAFLSLTHTIPRVGPTAEHDLPAEAISFDEDGFRCYPLRGDSLRLACRRIGPFLFKSLATLLLVAAAAALLFFLLIDIDADRRLAAGLSAVGVGGLVLAGLALRWVWRRTSPGRKAPLLPLALVATAGVVTVLLALADRRATVAVAIALAVPLAAVLGILVAYAGRGSLPPFGSGWLLVPPVLALAPALWAPYSLGPVADSLLYGLASLLAALLLVRLVGARAKDAGTGVSTGIYRALFTVTWPALAVAVIARFGEAWMWRSLAVILAVLLLIAYLVPRLAPGELRVHSRRPDRFGPAASAALQVSIAGLALVALDALAGDGAAAVAAEGIAAVIGVLAVLGAAYLLVVCRLNPRTLWWLRTGEMTPAGAAGFVGRQICVAPTRAGEPTPSDRKRRRMAGVVWRWRLHASEIADTNAAPFFKSFLSLEVHQDSLEISCWGVSGYRDPDRSPSLEDRIAIPLAPAGPAPHSAYGAPVVAARRR
jgi:Calcineurin-like phosphoesterase